MAASSRASAPYLRQISKYPLTAAVIRVRAAIPPIAVRSRATSSTHAGPKVLAGSAGSRGAREQHFVDVSGNTRLHPDGNCDEAAGAAARWPARSGALPCPCAPRRPAILRNSVVMMTAQNARRSNAAG